MLYAPGRGPRPTWGLLYRLDPRSKILFLASLTLYLALESNTEALLLALLALHFLTLLSRSTAARIGSLWKTLLPLIVSIVVLGSLRWRAQEALLALGPVTITAQSLCLAVGSSVRIMAMSFGFSLLLWTTEPGDAVAGLTRLGLPFEVGFPVVMALQYVVTFRRLFEQILEAQQSRGLTLPRGNPIRIARTYLPVLVPLIISALRSADNLALALQSRGFGAKRKRTSRRVLRFRAKDWVFVLLTWFVLAGLSQV
jgi:energy-coupling factor transport system permease protein